MEQDLQGRHKALKLLQEEMKAGRVLSGQNESDLRDAVDQHNHGNALIQGVLDQVTGTSDKPSPSPSASDPVESNAYHGRDNDIIVVDEDDLKDAIAAHQNEIVTVDESDLRAVKYEQERENTEYLEDLGSAVVTARTGVMQGSRAEVEARKKRI